MFVLSSLRVGEREGDHTDGRAIAEIIIAVVVAILGAEIAVAVEWQVVSGKLSVMREFLMRYLRPVCAMGYQLPGE